MKFKGNYWIGIQDIGGFTTLSEQLAKKGKKGTEQLSAIITNFFKEAENKILNCQGRIFKLAGDAFYAIFPGNIEKERLKILGKELLNLRILKKNNLKTRFVAVSGLIEGDWLQVSDNYQDLLINGQVLYDLNLLEEKTPAGKIDILSASLQKGTALPDFPSISQKLDYPPAHRPLYIVFFKVPQNIALVYLLSSFFCEQKDKIKLLKWIPTIDGFQALLIAGFPESSGKEAEMCIDIFNRLKTEFKGHKFKMGISSGIVFAGEIKTKKFTEFAVLGDSVNIAARLCALAPENSIYLSAEIQQVLKHRFNFTYVGATKLKGKEEKIGIYIPQERVAGVLNPARFSFKFVGRAKEFKTGLSLIRNNKSICFIGDGGTGKSRLLYELRKKIKQKNVIEVALLPVSSPLFLLKEIFKHFPEGEFPELKNYLNGSLQLPQIKVLELLKKLFKTKSNLIIFVEDLQWIDDVSFMLLKDLMPLPFIIIASSRQEGERFADKLKIEKIGCANLSSEHLKNLAEETLGAPPDKKFYNFLQERTQGNPFYFEQIIKDLQEKKFIINKGKKFSICDDAHTLPFSIHSILLSKFNNLSSSAKKLLEIGSCIGMEFSDQTIKKFFSNKNIDFKSTIDKGIILKNDRIFQFRHALFREAILDSLLDTHRKKYEKQIGEIFVQEGRSPYEIARHFTEAGNSYRALPYWADTFDELYSQGFQSEIAKIIQNLGSYDDTPTKNTSSFINALYLIKVSDYYDAEEILLKLKKIKSIKKEVLFALAGLYDWSNQYPKMERVLRALDKYPLNIKEKLLKTELWGIYYDMIGKNHEALLQYRKSLVLARQKNHLGALIGSYYNIGWIYFKKMEYLKAEKYFHQSLKFVKEGDLFDEGTALLRLGQIEMLKGNFEIAQNYLKKSLKNFQTISFPYWESIVLLALTELHILLNQKANAQYFARLHDEVANATKLYAAGYLKLLLYYGKLEDVEKIIKGKENLFCNEYFIYLLARGKKEEAYKFLKKQNLISIIPDKKTLKKKTSPLSFLSLYKKYTNG